MKQKHLDKYNKIGQNIKFYREKNNITQEELAEKLEISKSYISKIEAKNCDKTFSISLLFEVSESLKVDIRKFFEW